MYGFSPKTKAMIERFVNNGLLSKEIIVSVWKANDKDGVVKLFKKELSINSITISKVITYIWQQEWKNVDAVYDEAEIILLKEIIENDGVTTRTRVRKDLLNEYMTNRAIQSLNERGIIEVLECASKEKIIIIHPKFRQKVFKSG